MQPAHSPAPSANNQPAAHFVYNSLNLLQAYIQEGDKSGALSYLSRFSLMLRQWLNHTAAATVPLSADISLLDRYLALEQDRFVGRFDYAVSCDIAHADELLVKPLLWYQTVENALYHDILATEGRGLLQINFTLEESQPICLVSVSFPQAHNSSGPSSATHTIQLSL